MCDVLAPDPLVDAVLTQNVVAGFAVAQVAGDVAVIHAAAPQGPVPIVSVGHGVRLAARGHFTFCSSCSRRISLREVFMFTFHCAQGRRERVATRILTSRGGLGYVCSFHF